MAESSPNPLLAAPPPPPSSPPMAAVMQSSPPPTTAQALFLSEPAPLPLPEPQSAPPIAETAPAMPNVPSDSSADTQIVVTKLEEPVQYHYPAQSATSPLSSPPRPRKIRVNGVTLTVMRAEEVPNATVFGQRPPRQVAGTKRGREDDDWDARRNNILEDRIYRAHRNWPKPDRDGDVVFEPLPEWLNAVREVQDDGQPGVYLARPSAEDFQNRFAEMLQLLNQVGTYLGAVKIAVPDGWLRDVQSIQAPVLLASADSPPRARSQSPLAATAVVEDAASRPKSTTPPPPKRVKRAAHEFNPNATINGEPLIYTMNQYLPIHRHPDAPLSPMFSVISKKNQNKRPIGKTAFAKHKAPLDQAKYRISEDANILRGRTWGMIMEDNPAAAYEYSSDNDATPELRNYLGVKDPRLTELAGNVIDESTLKVVGIHTPYLYLGAAYTLFALHMEDYSALSLNYHHAGAPKSWRVVSPLDYAKLEELVQRVTGKRGCSQFVRHASLFVPGDCLRSSNIRSTHMRQHQGELVVTWPMAYHEGWNEGDNINEAIGYGGESWRSVWTGDGGKKVYRECRGKCDGGRGGGKPIRLSF